MLVWHDTFFLQTWSVVFVLIKLASDVESILWTILFLPLLSFPRSFLNSPSHSLSSWPCVLARTQCWLFSWWPRMFQHYTLSLNWLLATWLKKEHPHPKALCVSNVPLGACSHSKSWVQLKLKRPDITMFMASAWLMSRFNTLNLTYVSANVVKIGIGVCVWNSPPSSSLYSLT